MALVFIGIDGVPTYTALSSDIQSNTIAGISHVGGTVFITNTGDWYIIKKDLTLAVYTLPVTLGGSITVGAVNQGTASATEKWLVDTGAVSVVSATNSSATPLAGNATFSGTYIDLTNYANVSVMVTANVASATDGLHVAWSTDGINEDDHDVFTIQAGTSKQYTFGVTSKYMKVDYTNGASAQGTFRLQTLLHRVPTKPSSHRIDSSIVTDDDAELVKAVITAKTPSGGYKNIGATEDGILLVGIDDIQADAGSRVRVSQMTTLGDYKILGYDRTSMFDNQGTGTGTWASNKFTMSVTSGQYYVRHSRRFHPYFSGKSQMVEETFYGFAPQANVTKRVGYFSGNSASPYGSTLDGFWLQSSVGTITLKASRAGTLTLDKEITSWSGYENLGEYKSLATWDNFTVVLFDFLWLGGAVLRLWVKTSNGFVLAHVFHYSGTEANVFILSPNQPIRYDITSSTGSGSLTYVCAQCSTEGSVNESGLSGYTDTAGVISFTSNATTYPVKAIRKASAYRDVPVLFESAELMVNSSNDRARWSLQINPTLSAPLTYSSIGSTAVEQANGNGTITVTGSGIVIAGGSLSDSSPINNEQLNLNFLSWLGSSLNNTMEEYVLCISPISGSLSAYGGIGFKIF